jgi:hypothetical protein
LFGLRDISLGVRTFAYFRHAKVTFLKKHCATQTQKTMLLKATK